eukprot:7309294-Pyramimonas_sp.AAC.1
MHVRATRALPGLCPTSVPTALTPLDELLVPLEGELNPLNVGTTLPASITNDDRLIIKFHKGNVGIWRCDGCPSGTEGHRWGPGQAYPDMYGHAADPEGLRDGLNLVHGLLPYS